jgi:hypothetical protein
MFKVMYDCPICGRDERRKPCEHTQEEWQAFVTEKYGSEVEIVDLRPCAPKSTQH